VSRPVRVAGRILEDDGRVILWSVAEGGRGRRWRESTFDGADGPLLRTITLETTADGRPARFEAAVRNALLTLHPEADRVVHGNVVTTRGVVPLELGPFDGPAIYDLPGSPLVDAVICGSLAGLLAPGERRQLAVARIGLADLPDGRGWEVVTADLRVQRIGDDRWRLSGSGLDDRSARIDRDGLPDGGERWPLEEGGDER
jgi:hypothetical protein